MLIPSETAGPYPLYSVLGNAAMRRRDLTEGRPGVPLRLKLKVVNLNAACAPLSDVAVYVWHCDRDGVYSVYSQPGSNTTGQTFCRGIQYSDCNGVADFTTLYPGWYSGRITHVHFQICLNLSGSVTATSQFTIPQAVTHEVYNSSLYAAHGQNTSVASIAQYSVFSDGVSNQMLTVSGDVVAGYVGLFQIGVAI